MPGLDSYTKLLLHCNGVDGSTSFTDDSVSLHAITPNDNAQIDTAQSKFGGASGLFDGTNDYLTALDNSDWNFGTGDFTIDFWVRRNGSQNDFSGLMGASNISTVGWELDWGYDGNGSKHRIRFLSSYGGWSEKIVSSITISNLTWTHIALVRYGNVLTMYFNGNSVGTLNVNSYTFDSGSQGLSIAKLRMGLAGYNHNGWLDEIRISKGIARWTTNFTPPTSEYGPDNQVLTSNESILFTDTYSILINPESQGLTDVLVLSEIWNVHLSNAPEVLNTNEDLLISENWELFINPEQQIFDEHIHVEDAWNLIAVGDFKIKLNTDFRWLQTIITSISTSFSWLKAKFLNTDFRWLGKVNKSLSTDFRWLAQPYTDLTQYPINYTDIQIFINGVDIFLGNDLNLQSGNITHTIGNTSSANFILARRHDDLNRTHLGIASQITNQNPVQIYISGHLEFDGYISAIAVDSQNESVSVTCKMDEPADNRHSIELPLPSINEQIHLYHCLVNNVSIDNPKEDTRSVIIGSNGRYWNGSSWVFYIEDALTFNTDINAENYITNLINTEKSIINEFDRIFTKKSPSVTSRERNPQYYKGIKANLGKKIEQQIDKYRQLEYQFNGKGHYAQQIEDGTFITKPNYSYFWAVLAKNALTGLHNVDYRYIGTSLGSTTTDLWILNGVVPMYQRIKDNIETDLSYYYTGSAPFKEISPKNGWLIPQQKWEDRNDGLYNVLEASYDYRSYVRRVADLEYNKLKNVHGDILPVTSANLDVTFDGYYYYNVKLLTRINVTNTTVLNTYNNLNGFPVSVKSININFSTMKITLGCDNRLSQKEIDEIDEQMPDEESSSYVTPESLVLVYRKFDLKTWKFVS